MMKRSILSLIYLIKGMRQAGIEVDARLARIGISVDALDPSAILHSSIEWNIQNIIANNNTQLKVMGTTYVADDLEVTGSAKIDLNGEYYGYDKFDF